MLGEPNKNRNARKESRFLLSRSLRWRYNVSFRKSRPRLGRRNAFLRRLKALAMFLIGTMFLSVLVLLAVESFGPGLLLEVVNRTAREMGGPTVEASVFLDLLGGQARIDKLTVRFPDGNRLSVEQFQVKVDLWALPYNRLAITEVLVVSPSVEWRMSPTPEAPPSEPPNSFHPDEAFSLPNLPFALEIGHVLIQKATAQFTLAGQAPSTLEPLSFELTPEGDTHRLLLESGALSLYLAEMRILVTRIEAEALLDLAKKTLDLGHLYATLPGTLLSLSGKLQADPLDGALRLHLHLPLEELVDTLLPAVPGMLPLTGFLTVDADATGPLSNPKATGLLKLDDVAWQSEPGLDNYYNPKDFHLPFEVTPEGVTVEQGVWYTGDAGDRMGYVHFPKAHVAFDKQLRTRADLRCDGCDVAQICEDFSVRDSRARFRADGPLFLEGTLIPFDLRGEVDFDIRDFFVDAKPYREALAGRGDMILSLAKAHFHTKHELNGQYYRFVDGMVTSKNSRVAVGLTQFGFDSQFHFEYSSDLLHMKDVGPIAGMVYDGHGSLWMTLRGEASNPLITAGVDMQDFSLEGFPTGHTKADIRYFDRLLQFQNIEAQKPSGLLHGRLDLDFTNDPLKLHAEVQTDGLSAKDLVHTVKLDKSIARHLSGNIVGRGLVQGTPDDLNGGARLSFSSLSLGDQGMDKGHCQADFQHNTVTFSDCALERENGTLEATGTLTHWNEWDLRVSSNGLTLSMIDPLSEVFKDNHTAITLKGRVDGTMDDPRITADMLWAPTRLYGAPVGPSEFHLELTFDSLRLAGSLFDKQLRQTVIASFDETDTLSLDLAAKDLQLAPLIMVTTGFPLENLLVTGKIQARTKLQDFWQLQGSAEIERLTLARNGLTFQNTGPFAILLEEDKLTLPPVTFIGKKSNLEVQATWQKEQMADVLVRGETDWRVLEAFTDTVEQAYGPVRLSLHWFGKGNRPHHVGNLSFAQGFLKLADWDVPLENLQGNLDLDTGQVAIRELRFGYNGGSVQANGLMTLDPENLTVTETDIAARLDRVLFSLREDLDPILSGTLRLTGAPWPLQLSGNLDIKQLDYVKDIPWKRALIMDKIREATRPRRGGRALDRNTATPPKLAFDVRVKADNTLRVRNNVADLELKADLVLSGTNEQPGLLNTISTDTGSVFFQENEFEVQRFIVEFRDESKLDPYVDIAATHEISYMEDSIERSTTITLSLRGPIDNPEFLLTADNGMSQTDILSLLVLGQTANNLQSGQGMSTGLGALSDVYGVNQQIKKQFQLDEFRLSGDTTDDPESGTSLTPKLVVGKEIAQDVFLYFTTSLGGEADTQNDKKFEVKYKKKNWTLSGQWDNDGETEQGNFGFDLQYHIDF